MITVVLPFVSNVNHLHQALRSVFAQTVVDWRLLLVQDGADQATCTLVDSIRDDRVRLIGDARRLGLAARLNQAIYEVETRFTARMDADDIMFPCRLERLLSRLEAPDVPDVVGSRAAVIDDASRLYREFKEPPLPTTPSGYLRSNAFTHPTVAGRTDWFRANPYRANLRRAQDKELWLRSSRHSRFVKLEEVLLFYRVGRAIRRPLYAASSQANRQILREYGPELIGSSATVRLLAASSAKQFLVTLMNGHRGFEEWYFRQRLVAMPAPSSWRTDLDTVLATPIPGVDG
jgi:glycosyltransferase involved in cell wall biosynthesis